MTVDISALLNLPETPEDVPSYLQQAIPALVQAIQENGHDHKFWPRWRVHKNDVDDQNNIGTSEVVVTWSTADFDEGANVNLSSTYDFTVPTGADGIYVFSAAVRFAQNADNDQLVVGIAVDGSIIGQISHILDGANTTSIPIPLILKLAVGAKVDVRARNTGTTTSDIKGGTIQSWFSGCRIA